MMRKLRTQILLLLFLVVIVNGLQLYINFACRQQKLWSISFAQPDFRAMKITATREEICSGADALQLPVGEYLLILMIDNHYEVSSEKIGALTKKKAYKIRNACMRRNAKNFLAMSDALGSIVQDMQCFPVAASTEKIPWVSYENSWGGERTYGGKRTHEGTDIFAGEPVEGIYPVLSATDGTVTNVGWLELGGYRIGITTAKGVYYYYAHLANMPTLQEGDTVTAGTILGYMGSTGYSKVPGTNGKFPVHLHFGIYLTAPNKTELAINPYYFLKMTETQKRTYHYTK